MPLLYDPAKLDSHFTYEPPTEIQKPIYEEIEASARVLGQVISAHANQADICAELALQKIEEAVYWGKKAARRNTQKG